MSWPGREKRKAAAARFYAAADKMALVSASMPALTAELWHVLDRLEQHAAALASAYPPPLAPHEPDPSDPPTDPDSPLQ